MITQDNLATAQIAQIFGSELLKVQKNATTDSGSEPQIVNINPKQFLVNDARFVQQRKAEEARLLQMLQAEAEAQCPLPPDQQLNQPATNSLPQQIPIPAPTQLVPPPTRVVQTNALPAAGDVWEKINANLERIANCLEKVDLSVKRKRVKRIKK